MLKIEKINVNTVESARSFASDQSNRWYDSHGVSQFGSGCAFLDSQTKYVNFQWLLTVFDHSALMTWRQNLQETQTLAVYCLTKSGTA